MGLSPKRRIKHERHLAYLVFRLGGVAGVSWRIVRGQTGPFTKMQILGTLWLRYPGLEPAPQQLEDLIAHWERRQFIECIQSDGHGKVYRRRPYQPKAAEPQRLRQLSFADWVKT